MSSLTVTTIQTDTIKSLISETTALTIDSSGRTTLPNAPVFYGYRNNVDKGWEDYGTTFPPTNDSQIFIYNYAVTNRGNCYNTGNGSFTCPIAGVYAICPGALIGNTAYGRLSVFKNGVNETKYGVLGNANTYGHWFHCSTVFMIRCVKNDILQIRADTNGTGIFGQDGYSHCTIWLYS